MIADKNWLYKLGGEAESAEREHIIAEINKHLSAGQEGGEQSLHPESGGDLALAGRVGDDKLLLHSILDFNSSLYSGAGAAGNPDEEPQALERPSTADAANLTFLENRLARKPRKKKVNPAYSLGSIKYKPKKNPALLNISTAHFQDLLERHNLAPKSLGKSQSTSALRLGSDGRATYSDDYSQARAAREQEGGGPGLRGNGSNQEGGGGVVGSFSTEDLLGLDKEMLIALLLQERMANTATPREGEAVGRPQSADQAAQLSVREKSASRGAEERTNNGRAKPGSAGGLLAAVPENEGMSDAAMMALLEQPVSSSKPPSRLEPLEPASIATSPIKPSSAASGARPASGSGLSLLSKSVDSGLMDMTAPAAADPASSLLMTQASALSGSGPKLALTSALQTAVNRDGRSTPGDFMAPTPRGAAATQRPGTGLMKSASTNSVSDKRAAAAKQGGKGLTGLSVSAKMGTTGSLSKARMAEIRSLRDYMMTVSGAFAMNVNPDASPSAQQEVAESIAVTKDMVRETVRKNRVDQTWTLFSTPGYYEAVGPAEIFKSDVNKNFIRDDKFDKAVRESDITKGIKTSPLRVWSENGIKNGVKIFQSGGAMRT
jgi:hypothetical protein